MAEYIDMNGETRVINLNMAAVIRLKKATGLDLSAISRDIPALTATLERIAVDRDYTMDCMAALEGGTVEDLYYSGNGALLERLEDCFVNAIYEWIPESSPIKQPLAKLIESARELQRQQCAAIRDRVTEVLNTTSLEELLSKSAP